MPAVLLKIGEQCRIVLDEKPQELLGQHGALVGDRRLDLLDLTKAEIGHGVVDDVVLPHREPAPSGREKASDQDDRDCTDRLVQLVLQGGADRHHYGLTRSAVRNSTVNGWKSPGSGDGSLQGSLGRRQSPSSRDIRRSAEVGDLLAVDRGGPQARNDLDRAAGLGRDDEVRPRARRQSG